MKKLAPDKLKIGYRDLPLSPLVPTEKVGRLTVVVNFDALSNWIRCLYDFTIFQNGDWYVV
jgi:hypothetical protein